MKILPIHNEVMIFPAVTPKLKVYSMQMNFTEPSTFCTNIKSCLTLMLNHDFLCDFEFKDIHFSDNFSQDGTEICRGRLDDFGTILSPAFRAATVFVGIAVIISIICIIAFVLFFMCRYISSITLFKVKSRLVSVG